MKRIAEFLVVVSVPLVVVLVALSGFAEEVNQNIEQAGYIQTEIWSKVNNDSNHEFLSSLKTTVDLESQYRLSDNWYFFFHPRYFYDFAYDIRDEFDPNQESMGNTQRTEWLRDCYLDYISDELDVRLGKQQVVWGQMDLPILDRVMPWDLSWWWLPDLADMRIPLWMAKVEYSPSLDSSLQFLLIPDSETTRVGLENTPFAFKSTNDFFKVKRRVESAGGSMNVSLLKPAKKFENSTFGLRWRAFAGDWEYTLNWLYGYSTSDYLYLDALKNVSGYLGSVPVGDYYYARRHKRIQLWGLSFNRSFVDPGVLEGLTLKGEFAYVHDEPTYYGVSGSRKITEVSDKYNYGIALEKYFFTKWLFALQFLQFITNDYSREGYKLLDNASYGLQDKVETYLTLKIKTHFMHGRLKPDILLVYQDDNSGRIVPKFNFELRDDLWVQLGYAHFYGRIDTPNGEFRNNDQIFSKVKYTF
ncbi:MAG: hypothetical protein J7J51_02275 [Candidatus Omnitrophica bacterium]|nr:hypothetical protein [Candidatus Omnitrophota bacterium]